MPPTSSQTFGPWGCLPSDKLLPILAQLDARSLRAADRTCRSWRALIRGSDLWRKQYLALQDVPILAKWRYEALERANEGGEDPWPVGKNVVERQMPAGDGRGVSGPPSDKATIYTLALHSKWAEEFKEEVISKLAADDPLRAQIFDDNGEVREPAVPDITGMVYQWGTRLDKPDWRELAISHLQTRDNWLAGRVVSSITVPLRVPLKYKNLQFLGEDPGDDSFLFRAATVEPVGELEDQDSHEATLICVERTTGNIRYVISLPWDHENNRWRVMEGIGLIGERGTWSNLLLPNGRRPNCRSFISGRTFNHLCKNLHPKLPRDSYLQALDDLPYEVWYSNHFDLDNCGDHIDITDVLEVGNDHYKGRWEKLSQTTARTNDWKVTASTKKKPNSATSMLFTDKYMFVEYRAYPKGIVTVCARDTGEFVLDKFMSPKLLAEKAVPKRFGFVYQLDHEKLGSVPKGGLGKAGREIRPFELGLLQPGSKPYKTFFTDLLSHCHQRDGSLTPNIDSIAVTKRGPGIFGIKGGYVIIPRMQEVMDGVRRVSFKDRADYITQHSIILITELDDAELVNDTVVLRTADQAADTSSFFVLDLELLPTLSPDMAETPKLSGRAILQSNPEGWICVSAHVFSGHILELLQEPEEESSDDESQYTYWLDWLKPCNTMLRITSFVPELESPEK